MQFPRLAGLCVAASLALAQSGSLSQQIAAHLTAKALESDVSFLASDALMGRATPSPGQEIAAEFIAAQFRRAGLEPAGDDGYFQTALFESTTPRLEDLEFTVEAEGKKVSVPESAMALLDPAPVDLRGVPVEGGNIALVEGRGMAQALSADAKPSLVVLLSSGGRGMTSMPRVHEAAATSSPIPILAVWDEAAKVALKAKDATVSAHISPPVTTPVKLRNVIGVLRGSDPVLKETYVLVTAHYDHLGVRGSGEGDHIFNGANDDASGTASVMEIAQTLAALSSRPKRSIVFMAVFGEEMGLLGSRYYGRHPVFPLGKTVADLNLEQLGRTDVDGGQRVGIVNVTGFDYTTVTDELRKAGEDTGIKVEKDEKASDPYFARSDNQALADAGIPAHTLSVGYVFPDYHGAGDEWPKLDYVNMAKVDRTVALAVYRIADNTDTPQWNKTNPRTERYIKAREASQSSAK